jgi:oxygen-independent coproporphyrinogen-3 oxidase
MAGRESRPLAPASSRPTGAALGLYIHIPFCQALCHYCNFNRGLFDAAQKARYVEALEKEIVRASDPIRAADTVFFGGGTPSLLEPAEVGRLIAACRAAYALSADAEIALETNPETVTADRLAGFREAGVNRLSVGVQSFQDDELRRLGRIHTADRAAQAIALAREAGFDNISLDLMCWLPGQSPDSWRSTVTRAIELAPDHLSFYLLELYPNAPLKETMARAAAAGTGGAPDSAWAQVEDDRAADMYLDALDRLDRAGYAQYEISNVARGGRESRHNLKYWTMGEWVGFGCGAHSTCGGARWQNVASVSDYVARIDAGRPVELDRQHPSAAAWAEEALFTGLRLTRGVDADAIEAAYGVRSWETYGENLALALEAGLLWRTGPRFGLTRRGMLVSNDVLAAFV